MYILILQRLFLEALFDVVYFPVWWYTGGVKHAGLRCLELCKQGNRALAPGLWLVNIFVPMYGQYDWQGRLISFFIRSANVFGRALALGVWLAVCLVFFFIYMAFPIVIVLGILKTTGRS